MPLQNESSEQEEDDPWWVKALALAAAIAAIALITHSAGWLKF